MAKLKKRADGRYQLKVTLPNGQIRFVYGRTQKEAQEKKSDLLMQYGRGVTDFRAVTLEEWTGIWWETRKRGSTGNSDQRSTKMLLERHIIPALGAMPVQNIRPIDVEKLLKKTGKSRSLQKHIVSVLNGIFKYAIENGLIYGNPAQYVRAGGEKGTREALTSAQQAELLKAAKGTTGETIILLAYYLGLRRGEIAGLHWTDVDREAHTVHIQRAVEFIGNQPREKSTKTAAGDRILPVPDALWEHLVKLEKKSVFVACKKDGGQLSEIAIRRQMEPIQRRLSFRLTLHALRHTYATRLDLLGIAPKTCQYLLGHASLDVTKGIYTHILPEHLEDAKRTLAGL